MADGGLPLRLAAALRVSLPAVVVAAARPPPITQGHVDRVTAIADLGGGRLASGSFDGTLRVWCGRPPLLPPAAAAAALLLRRARCAPAIIASCCCMLKPKYLEQYAFVL